MEDSKLIADGAVDTIDLDSEAEDLELDIRNGANITLKNGNASTYGQVNIDDGRLNASIWQDDNKFKNVTVNEGGIFNVTKLNSGGDPAEPSTHNKLLLAKSLATHWMAASSMWPDQNGWEPSKLVRLIRKVR